MKAIKISPTFSLPERTGEAPVTGATVPHLQHSQTSPPEYVEVLMAWATESLPDVRETPTQISVATTRALWLDESVAAANSDSFMPPFGNREFAHVHADGSMHLCVSDSSVSEIISKNWGELHPFKNQGVNEVLFFAPRNKQEISLAKQAIIESYRYATGREIPLNSLTNIDVLSQGD